jgi:endonuclease/exonuclease/phosphatase (EEP) superfamily protein YafD
VTIGGTKVFSRFPVSDPVSLSPSPSQYQQWLMKISIPRLGPVGLIAAHPCNPYCGSNLWQSEHEQLRDAARYSMDRPLVVAGDLNAVDDHGPLRAMRRDGMESVADILGAGWLPTYPAGGHFPPLLPIDHVLVNHFLTATSISRFDVAGTDHLGLMVDLAGTR